MPNKIDGKKTQELIRKHPRKSPVHESEILEEVLGLWIFLHFLKCFLTFFYRVLMICMSQFKTPAGVQERMEKFRTHDLRDVTGNLIVE